MAASIDHLPAMRAHHPLLLTAGILLCTGCTVYHSVPTATAELPAPPERDQIVFAIKDGADTSRMWVVHHATVTPQGLHGSFFTVVGEFANRARQLEDERSVELLAPSYLYTLDTAWHAPAAEGDTATIPFAMLRRAQLVDVDRQRSRQRTAIAWVGSVIGVGILVSLIAIGLNKVSIGVNVI